MTRVAVIDPWGGGSHAAWTTGLLDHSCHDVDVLTLPDRGWRWRMRGAAPWFAERVQALDPAPDVLLVTSLVDAAALRGLIGRDLPMVLYAHETQWEYPSDRSDVEHAVRDLISMLTVDQIWFNSRFHRRVALQSTVALLDLMPAEQRVDAQAELVDKSCVVYPGVDLSWATPSPAGPGPPIVLWPHRWEADKNPDVFERAVVGLDRAGLDFGLVLAGADSVSASSVRARLVERFAERILATGPFDTDSYRRWLQRSHLVVSCTAHEFFGMAVVEALAAGCRPVLPQAFSYPEIVGPAGRDRLYKPRTFGSALADAVRRWPNVGPAVPVGRFAWSRRILDYDERLAALGVDGRSRSGPVGGTPGGSRRVGALNSTIASGAATSRAVEAPRPTGR